jgi:hypothetical protein
MLACSGHLDPPLLLLRLLACSGRLGQPLLLLLMRPLPPMLLMRLLGCSGRLWQHVAEGGAGRHRQAQAFGLHDGQSSRLSNS